MYAPLHSVQHFLFFFDAPATAQIYSLSLHDALPIYRAVGQYEFSRASRLCAMSRRYVLTVAPSLERSEEHTSELQSRFDLVCRLLLEKKNERALLAHSPVTSTILTSYSVPSPTISAN